MCDACLETEILPVPSRCYRCQKATRDFAVCTSCRRKSALRHVWVRTIYDTVSSKPLIAFKFERVRAAHIPLGKSLTETTPVIPTDTLVIGTPTATGRIRERGYDHVRLLVRQFAAPMKLTWVTPLVRTGQAHQFGSGRATRLKQLEKAFHVVQPEAVKGKNILLVDDVLTTGATLEALARVLKDAGAKKVDAVVFAQKV